MDYKEIWYMLSTGAIPDGYWMHRSQYTSPLRMEHFLPERLSVGRGYCKPTILGLDGRKTGYRL